MRILQHKHVTSHQKNTLTKLRSSSKKWISFTVSLWRSCVFYLHFLWASSFCWAIQDWEVSAILEATHVLEFPEEPQKRNNTYGFTLINILVPDVLASLIPCHCYGCHKFLVAFVEWLFGLWNPLAPWNWLLKKLQKTVDGVVFLCYKKITSKGVANCF